MARIKITAGSTAGGTARAATHYGTRPANEGGATKYNVSQNLEKLEIKFDYTQVNADTVRESADAIFQSLPVGAVIKRTVLVVETSFVSPTTPNMQPQLVDENGISPDTDGLHAVSIPEAALTAGATFEGDGAQINGTKQTVELWLDVDSSATDWTAGEATYHIEYEVYDYL